MRRAIEHIPKGDVGSGDVIATATLDFDRRNRRRLKLSDDSGTPFLLDLPDVVTLRAGDVLRLDGGGCIVISEAPEPVVDARASDAHATARLAWHLGNRHLPVQILPDGSIRFRADSVIEAMVEGLGATIRRHDAPFTPEAGAYAKHDHGATQ
jgi:urease accessory protein